MNKLRPLGYYSHHFKTFNTPEETNQYNWLKKKFKGFVINPNKHLIEKNPLVVNKYWQTINKINVLFISPYRNKIDRASYYEAKQCLLNKINVYEVYKVNKTYAVRKVIDLKVINEKNLSAFAVLVNDENNNLNTK